MAGLDQAIGYPQQIATDAIPVSNHRARMTGSSPVMTGRDRCVGYVKSKGGWYYCFVTTGCIEINSHFRENVMLMLTESLVVFLVLGVIAGWLASTIVEGTGYGLIGDMVIGVFGALIGGTLLPVVGIERRPGIISAIVTALIGAVFLLVILRLVRGGGRWTKI